MTSTTVAPLDLQKAVKGRLGLEGAERQMTTGRRRRNPR